MQVKIILRRRAKRTIHSDLTPLLLKLRNLAMNQGGYISGETLVNKDDPDDHIVISTWKSYDAWNKWLESRERQEVQRQVDDVLGEPTYYSVYYYS